MLLLRLLYGIAGFHSTSRKQENNTAVWPKSESLISETEVPNPKLPQRPLVVLLLPLRRLSPLKAEVPSPMPGWAIVTTTSCEDTRSINQ